MVRQQQLRRVKDGKALAGEYVTIQHKPVVFEVRMREWKKRTMGPTNFKGALYRIQILCRRYTFWSYPAGLTIADPPGKQKLKYRRVYSHHFQTTIAESIHTTPNSIQCPFKWWKCKDEMMVEYREMVRRKYDELDEEKGTVEGEWRQYKDACVGVAEELCSRTSGKGGTGVY